MFKQLSFCQKSWLAVFPIRLSPPFPASFLPLPVCPVSDTEATSDTGRRSRHTACQHVFCHLTLSVLVRGSGTDRMLLMLGRFNPTLFASSEGTKPSACRPGDGNQVWAPVRTVSALPVNEHHPFLNLGFAILRLKIPGNKKIFSC